MEVDIPMYHMAYVLVSLEDLKSKGFISGGFNADTESLKAIVTIGEKLDYPKPTDEELSRILETVQESLTNEV